MDIINVLAVGIVCPGLHGSQQLIALNVLGVLKHTYGASG